MCDLRFQIRRLIRYDPENRVLCLGAQRESDGKYVWSYFGIDEIYDASFDMVEWGWREVFERISGSG